MISSRRDRRWWRAGSLALALAAPEAARAVPRKIDVPSQPAKSGIQALALQTGLQILARQDDLDGKHIRAVKGEFEPVIAIRLAFEDSGLAVSCADRRTCIISLARKTVPSLRGVERRLPRPRPIVRPSTPRRIDPAPDIIVTGTAAPQRRFDAGLAITTASLDRIHELAPNNTADLLKVAPGIWAETTGGATGANIFVRGFPTTGDSPFLTLQLDGAPIFPPTELLFSENTTLFRIDDMIDRAEILRGGTGLIFSNGQPGAVANFIQRSGTRTPGGGLRLTVTDFGSKRADGYYTGPLGPASTIALGGFYRQSNGIRNTQFAADQGGQLSANVTHDVPDGVIKAYARYTRDRNAFYTGMPLIADGAGGVGAFPGFDPLKDTLIGADARHLSIEIGRNDLLPVDLKDGRGLDMLVAGASADWSPDAGPHVTGRVNFTRGDADTVGLFTGPVPTTLGDYIAALVARANGDPRVTAAAGRVSSGHARIAADGRPLSPDQYVLTAGLWSVRKRISSLTGELRLSGAFHGHEVTGGLYLSNYRSDDIRHIGNNLLLTATPNARRVDVRLDNGVLASRDGFVSASTSQTLADSSGTNAALFLYDKWSLSARTHIDAGIRAEHQWLEGRVRDTLANQDFDGDPRTLFNNGGALLLASSTSLRNRAFRLSWTAGIVHRAIPDRITLHARFNHGSNLQSFDKLLAGGRRKESANMIEAGVEAATGPVRASVNAFANRFTGLQFSRFLAQPDGGVGSIVLAGGARAIGIEVDADISPAPRWKIELRGTYEDGRYRGFGGNSGNRIVRQPDVQFAVTPAYTIALARARVKLRATYGFVGKRYSDVENLQPLPSYATVDAGVHADLDGGIYADLIVQNAFDTFGLTEGNTRALGAALSSGAIIARPLFGRNISLSLGYRF